MTKGRLRSRTARLGASLVALHLFSTAAAQDPGLVLGTPIRTNAEVRFDLRGEAGVAYVLQSSDDLSNWVSVATNSEGGIARVISLPAANDVSFFRAQRGPLPVFEGALAALQTIKLGGPDSKDDMIIDSFDSGNPVYSTNGRYDPSKREDGGDVLTDSSSLSAVQVGNVAIMGHVRTGPGGGITTAPHTSVGSKTWVQSGNSGFQPGWVADDVNVHWPDVTLPSTTWLAPPGGGTIDGVYYDIILTASGNYYDLTPWASIYVGTNVHAMVMVSGNLTLTNSNGIHIAPLGASLTIYVAGSGCVLSSEAIVNESPFAGNFRYLGLPSNTNLHLSMVSGFLGTIYAPEADCLYENPRTNIVADFVGASVTRSVTASGPLLFHFDEDLLWSGPRR